MVNWKRVAFWATLFYWVYTAPLADSKDRNDPIRLWLYPRANFCVLEPCYVHAIVFVKQHKDNRWMVIDWYSDWGESGSALVQMEGEKSSLVAFDRQVRLGQGDYLFEACIYRIKAKYCDRKLMIGGTGEH